MDKRFYLQDSLYKGIIDKGVDFAICGVGAFFVLSSGDGTCEEARRPPSRKGRARLCLPVE
jgi:hypothetical protein